WNRSSVSFGRNEPASALYDRAALSEAGTHCVRRPTGGRAVVHERELTYCVVVPARAWGGPRRAYRRLNDALAAALRSLRAPAEVSAAGASQGPGAGPCFAAPAPGEVVAGGRKLVGSAQARIGGALLQHGSILVGGDQALLERAARPGRS